MSTIDLSPRPLTDGAAAAARVFAKLRHDPAGIALTLGAPVVMVLLFGYVFGSAIVVPGSGDYREYLVPGLFVVIAFMLSRREQWPLGFTLTTIAAGTVPILSFWAERRATEQVTRQHALS